MSWSRYTARDIHYALIAKHPPKDSDLAQALHCPYYVPLEGRLGADWGVIVNPLSSRFGEVTFEHSDCGCPSPGWLQNEPRHLGAPSQEGDTWDVDWRHEHSDYCDEPCEDL